MSGFARSFTDVVVDGGREQLFGVVMVVMVHDPKSRVPLTGEQMQQVLFFDGDN